MPDRYTATIRDLPQDERPRERLLRYGASNVSTVELLAIQLGTGTPERSALGLAEQLVHRFNGLRGLALATPEELQSLRGVGAAKAVSLLSALEIGRRLSVVDAETKPSVKTPQDVANLLMSELRDLRTEHFKALHLDARHRVIRAVDISHGTLDSALVHPREVFRDAILSNAATVVVAHNHPSGDPSPSADDRAVTLRLVEAGKLIGIDVLDHVIIGHNQWASMKKLGYL